MRTLALFFLLMVALSVTHGRRRFKVAKKCQYTLKKWIIRSFDRQLNRFLIMSKDKFKLNPNQVKALRYVNRQHMLRNCQFYQKYATQYLMRRRFPLNEKTYGAMGRYIGLRERMICRYYWMASRKKIPKLTKSMELTLAKKPGDLSC
nr:sp18 [Haliotis tuberculata]